MPIRATPKPEKVYRTGANSVGSFETTDTEDYAAYDKLPPSIKRMLQDAPLDFACVAVYERWQQARGMGWTDLEFRRWLAKAIQTEYRAALVRSWRAVHWKNKCTQVHEGG